MIIYILLCVLSVAFADAINLGSILRPPDGVWHSKGGNFTFGFHSAANDENKYVVGISFGNINETTLAWTLTAGGVSVSNRSQLQFQSNGDLLLFGSEGNVVWTSNTSDRGVVSAEMRDDGNFVLSNRSSGVVWESFGNPTDTLLAGQRFSEGETLRVDSYSFSVESGGNVTLKWRNSITYWNASASSEPSGRVTLSLNNEGIFALTDSTVHCGSNKQRGTISSVLTACGNFTFGFHSAANETTLTWTLTTGGVTVRDGNVEGNLLLFDSEGNVVWTSNTSDRDVVSAEMRDNGNFVLSNRSSGVVWESFGNPRDTLLAGQGFSEGETLRVDSYSISVESGGNVKLKWRNSITYWNASASSEPSGFLYWTARSSDYTDNRIKVRRVTLGSDGNLRSYGWHEDTQSWQVGWSAVEDQCRVYGWCGDNGICIYNDTGPHCVCPSLDFTAVDPEVAIAKQGCRRLEDIASCSNNQTMVRLDHTGFLSYPPELSSDKYVLGTTECWQNCLRNPSCTASTIMNDGSGSCLLMTSNFTSAYASLNIPSTSHVKVCGTGRSVSLLSLPSIKTQTSLKLSIAAIIVAVIGTVTALVIFETGLWWVCCRNNPRFVTLSTQYTLLEYASGAPVQFSYKELQQSTKNFRDKVGSGGFGTVYKGVLPNKTIVAVKKLEGIEQGEKQFRMEVATIGSTHHLNLVRLIGFCSEKRYRLLVYEFLKNTSLDTFLFGSTEQFRKLDWETRFGIALGTARGITYLHEECINSIIHCDIKPENILLDENFNAKVSDFGLAKLTNVKYHRNMTLSSVRGTRGYLAPEWLANLPITSKSDVFSYGMVLLELISGRRNFDISATSGRRKFSRWAFEQFERGNVLSIVDEKLEGKLDIDQVERAIKISFWCIQEQPSMRPPMGKIVQMLEGIFPIAKPPDPKSFGVQSNFSTNTSDPTTSAATTSATPSSSSSFVHGLVPSNSISEQTPSNSISEQHMEEILPCDS